MQGGERIRVVIVDDHLMFVESLTQLIQGEGDMDVVGTARTVAALKDCLMRANPDVILMDWRLPDGDGVSAARYVREELPAAQVVILTGFPDDALLLSAIEAGCSGFVSKEEAFREVASAVRAAAAGEAVIGSAMLGRLLPKLLRSKKGSGFDLTERETEVLGLMAEGLSSSGIAERLFISIHTARNHAQRILTKLNARSRLEAVAIGVREGIIRHPD